MPLSAAPDLGGIGPAFRDPVSDAQRIFRQALDAMAHPGRIVSIPADTLAVNDSGLGDAAAALALMLLDFETPVWLDAALRPAADFLRFHSGVRVVAEPAACRFGFAAVPASLPRLDTFDLGTDEYPDRSTTLVQEVQDLSAEGGVVLTGPGIPDRAQLHVGVGAAFWRARAALTPLFPRGLDIVFTAGRKLAALPRTTVVEGF